MGQPEKRKPRIGITVGDINGIGPEIIIKVMANSQIVNMLTPVVYGPVKALLDYKKLLQRDEFQFTVVKTPGQYALTTCNVVDCGEEGVEIKPGIPSRATGALALKALERAVAEIQEGHIDALVTGPIDKNTIHGEAFPYHGHTEYLTEKFNATESLMMMVSDDIRVGLVTEHVPLKDVPELITAERIELKIRLLELTLKNDFHIQKPKIAVLGFNPHAGDGGLLGAEEGEIIKPVIENLKSLGKLVFGPYSADGFFAAGQHRKYDATLAMYHDQGLIAFKTLAFGNGVNYTAGLPIVRTSPDHGTAYNVAGKHVADEGSLLQAIFLATSVVKQKSKETAGA